MLRIRIVGVAYRSSTYGGTQRRLLRWWQSWTREPRPTLRHTHLIPLHLVPFELEVAWSEPVENSPF
jgi:hypothetical protein